MALLNEKNTVFYSTSDDAYIPKSATSLLSIRHFLPKANLFIISRNISKYHENFLKKLGIGFLDIDLRSDFTRNWQYPVECYYLFAGPELFLEKGFEYSIYIDGDVLCLANPLQQTFNDDFCIAGVSGGRFSEIFGYDVDYIPKIFNTKKSSFEKERIQSGVVYFNNRSLKRIGFYKEAVNLFKTSLENLVPRKGDDSLLALFQITHLKDSDVVFMDRKYNCMFFPNKAISELPDGLVFAHFTDKKPWDIQPYTLTAHPNGLTRKWRRLYRKYFTRQWFIELKQIVRLVNFCKRAFAFFRNTKLASAGLKYWFLQRRRNSRSTPIKVFWSRDENLGITNFGDEFPLDLITECFGYKVCWSSPKDCSLFTIGSIMSQLDFIDSSKKVSCWGSGFISQNSKLSKKNNISNITFYALRGKKTVSKLEEITSNIATVPLGDPGILASVVYPKNKKKIDKIGFVAHFADVDLPVVRALRNDKRFLIINPLESPREVARQISSCKFVLSSSLHGLIFADSYKIPNAHVKLSKNVTGGSYKFQDYCSGVDKKYLCADVKKIFDSNYLKKLSLSYEPVPNLTRKQRELINAFPKFRRK